jgi:hypothetical protein
MRERKGGAKGLRRRGKKREEKGRGGPPKVGCMSPQGVNMALIVSRF